jgi:hypothetical protein
LPRTTARAAALLLALAAVAVVFFVARDGGEPVRALQTPELRPAPGILETARGAGGDAGEASEVAPDGGEMKIGGFEAPERVPEYEILEKRRDERDGARATRLLIDTRSRSEEDFTLIARDLKARYSGYDAVSAEFTDTTDVLSHNGGALIFNTYEGAVYMGYVYGPPNTDGYYVKAAD